MVAVRGCHAAARLPMQRWRRHCRPETRIRWGLVLLVLAVVFVFAIWPLHEEQQTYSSGGYGGSVTGVSSYTLDCGSALKASRPLRCLGRRTSPHSAARTRRRRTRGQPSRARVAFRCTSKGRTYADDRHRPNGSVPSQRDYDDAGAAASELLDKLERTRPWLRDSGRVDGGRVRRTQGEADGQSG